MWPRRKPTDWPTPLRVSATKKNWESQLDAIIAHKRRPLQSLARVSVDKGLHRSSIAEAYWHFLLSWRAFVATVAACHESGLLASSSAFNKYIAHGRARWSNSSKARLRAFVRLRQICGRPNSCDLNRAKCRSESPEKLAGMDCLRQSLIDVSARIQQEYEDGIFVVNKFFYCFTSKTVKLCTASIQIAKCPPLARLQARLLHYFWLCTVLLFYSWNSKKTCWRQRYCLHILAVFRH